MSSIIHPTHFQIYEHEGTKWYGKEMGKVFYNPTNEPVVYKHIEQQFGLTPEQVIIELFRINGGKPGYYLANLRTRKYYYCGLNWKNIKITLRELGIGRTDPVQS